MMRSAALLLTVSLAFVSSLPAISRGPTGCVLESVPASQDKRYRIFIPARGYIEFPCPTNTKFNKDKCICDWVDNPELPPPRTTQRPVIDPTGGTLEPLPLPTTPPPCYLRAHPNDRHKYVEDIFGFGSIDRDCPRGTMFNQVSCACHDRDPIEVGVCYPDIYLDFNSFPIEDNSGLHTPIGNNGNVVNVTNAGRFNGTSTLTIWMYNNVNFRTQVSTTFRFYDYEGGPYDEQVLVSNCYEPETGSIEIVLKQRTKELVFRVETTATGKGEIVLPYQEAAWKNVSMTYDGDYLTAQVDNEIKSVQMKGDIAQRYNGIMLGSCMGRGFVGYIDDFKFFRCLGGRRRIPNGNGLDMTRGAV